MAIEPKIIRHGQVTIIDPNPQHQVVDHEDLYIYASLVAKTKGRSFLTEGANGDTTQENINISTVDMVVSDTATSDGKKRQFLTTAWSDIGGSQLSDINARGDVEGFGITNIDIEIKGSYIPRVIIDFVDIRGATLFEQGSCSPYGMFFHLPYPIFELTIKGYYGKPVTYFLNLQKFNTKFNTETGNFECKAEFIGWSYAFLADMLMGYVRCANYMDGSWGAKESLRKKYDESVSYYIDNGIFDESDYFETASMVTILNGTHAGTLQPFCRNVGGNNVECKTISNLLTDISQIKIFLRQAKGDDDYVEIGNLITVKNSVVSMVADIRRFTSKLERDYGNQISETKLTQAVNSDGSTRNIKELYVFNQKPDQSLQDHIDRYWNRPINDGSQENKPNTNYGEIAVHVPQIKELVVKETDDGQKQCGGTYVAAASNKDRNNGLTNCQTIQEEGGELKFELLDFLDKTNIKFQKGVMDGGATYDNRANKYGDDYYIDVGYLTSILDKDIDTLNELIEKKRTSVKEAIDDGVIRILGFRPTIRNIFTILSCNVENFVQLLLKVSILAEEHHSEENKEAELNEQNGANSTEQLSILKKQSPGETPKKIYPWPTYYKTDYKSTTNYSVNNPKETKEQFPGANDKFKDWPEVRFVEDFIEACNRLNKADEDLIEEKESVPGFDNYMPIHPIESQLNGSIQLKYYEKLRAQLGGDLDDVIALVIAERMFVTLDFSYFDPIRFNEFNLGLGYSFPWRKPKKISGTAIDYEDFQETRIWQPTLYRNTDKSEDDLNPLTTIAKIDAHNLMSCITDPEHLSAINLNLFDTEERLYTFIEDLLKRETEQIDAPTDGKSKWFNPNANYTDLSTEFSTPNVLKQNLIDDPWVGENGDDYTEDYWAYYPKDGNIRLLGTGSAFGYGGEDSVTRIDINCDIRKMDTDNLFQLLEQREYEEKYQQGVNMDGYTGAEIIQDRRKLLQDNLANAIGQTQQAGWNAATGTEMEGNYACTDSNSKLVTFNDELSYKSNSLFTTLAIGYKTAKRNTDGFDIEFVGPIR